MVAPPFPYPRPEHPVRHWVPDDFVPSPAVPDGPPPHAVPQPVGPDPDGGPPDTPPPPAPHPPHAPPLPPAGCLALVVCEPAFRRLMAHLAGVPPEEGGFLLGPKDSPHVVTHYLPDLSGRTSPVAFKPDAAR